MKEFTTEISRNNYTQIKDRDMSPGEMIRFLEEGAVYRTFADILTSVYPQEDLVPRLVQGLSRISGKEYASILKKVRYWMKGDNTPQNREQLFQICFVLGLGERESDRLIASAAECGIHYRNPKEIVYAFALRTGRTYEQAISLQKEMSTIYEKEMKEGRRKKEKAQRQLPGRVFTRKIRDEFESVRTGEELRSFFEEQGKNLGEIHETAYEKFMELLDCLQRPRDQVKEERREKQIKLSMEDVVKEYLYMHVPHTKKSGNFTRLQKVIKKNWPAESELTKMKNRSMDVSRKVMLLLFLITEEFEEDGEEMLYYEDLLEDDSAERLEIRLNNINIFLGKYGMNLLDPGNPFDCLVLYALRAQYIEEGLSEKVEKAMEILFADQEEKSCLNLQ